MDPDYLVDPDDPVVLLDPYHQLHLGDHLLHLYLVHLLDLDYPVVLDYLVHHLNHLFLEGLSHLGNLTDLDYLVNLLVLDFLGILVHPYPLDLDFLEHPSVLDYLVVQLNPVDL